MAWRQKEEGVAWQERLSGRSGNGKSRTAWKAGPGRAVQQPQARRQGGEQGEGEAGGCKARQVRPGEAQLWGWRPTDSEDPPVVASESRKEHRLLGSPIPGSQDKAGWGV